jgi:vesicle-associated membrane protein 7
MVLLQAFGKRIPFMFLQEVQQEFMERYSSVALQAIAYEMNMEFSKVLQQRMYYFNTDPRADTITRVRGEVTDLKNVMVENIDRILERGERLEVLVSKTDDLSHQTFAFKRDARRLQQQMWWKNARSSAVVVALMLLALYIVAATVCSPTLQC